MKKLWCVSFIEFEQIAKLNNWDKQVPDNIAIISINNGSDAGSDEEYHVCQGNNVLNLNFDDVDPIAVGCNENDEFYVYKKCNGDEIVIEFFTNSMANKSVQFIEDNIEKDFYIHCSAGISRSQAFVKYIKNTYYDDVFEVNPNNPCLFPNGFVFQKLMQAYRNRVN